MTFWKAEPASHSGSSNVWLTPRPLLEALGPFDLDPAAHPGYETASNHFYESDDGLHKDWSGLVWLNPPYGVCTQDWVSRWVSHPNGFLLVACRTDNQWFHDAARAADLVLFPRGRIRFTSAEGKGNSPAFASALMARGQTAKKRLSKMNGLFMTTTREGGEG